MLKVNYTRLLAAVGLIAFGISSRIVLSHYPNIETVTLVTLLGGMLLGGYYSILVPLAVICGSDMYLGNTAIAIFTWTGFMGIGLAAFLARRRHAPDLTFKTVGWVTGLGLGGILAYDAWTAFGWWLLMYPHTSGTLGTVFVLQVPFTLRHLASGLLTIPAGTAAVLYVKQKVQTTWPALNGLANPLVKFD